MAERDNARLTAEVLARLRRDTFLRPLGIQVVADQGVVTLTGSIDTELSRQAAEDLARTVPGVREVRNHLTLIGQQSYARRDEDLEREVREQIASDPTIDDPERFHVRAQFGRVFVIGTAESLEERESVVAAIQRVPGVEGIEDRMEVRVPLVEEQREG